MPFHWPLIGHRHIKQYFEKAFAAGRINHAYLFEGPEQVGKFTFAKMLAQTLFCEGEVSEARPCGNCRACAAYLTGAHPDYFELRPEADAGSISILAIRECIKALRTMPLLSRYKIGIIEEAALLTQEAANALLKTLEEPGAHVILFLITAKTVLPTIASRLQRIRFNFVPASEIESGLSPLGIKSEIAQLAQGRVGLAMRFNEAAEYREYAARIKDLFNLCKSDEAAQVELLAREFSRKGDTAKERRDELRAKLRLAEALVRDRVFVKCGLGEYIQHRFLKDDLTKNTQDKNVPSLCAMLKRIEQSFMMLDSNVDPRIVAEYVFLGEGINLPRQFAQL
ncbi:hypothetical protein HY477_01495 [Candidatus Uhrbacteria bacterium]|nr:hypothetical protein [Candidatus Uhrbacteria bacterium]